MGTQTAYFRTTDFTHRLSTGSLAFERFYVSNGVAWSDWGSQGDYPVINIPKPFGSGDTGGGAKWWHTFWSMALVSSMGVSVARDTIGYQTEFGQCSPLSDCWAVPNGYSPGERSRLHLLTAGPELLRVDGSLLKYKKNYPATQVYFLTSIVSPSGKTIANVTHFDTNEVVSLPPLWSSPACTSSTRGMPFIKSVSFPAASETKLLFTYGLAGGDGGVLSDGGTNSECVLRGVDQQVGAGTPVPMVRYSYGTNASFLPELLSVATLSDGGVTESYSYSQGGVDVFDRYAYGQQQGLIQRKNLAADGKVTSSFGGEATRSSLSLVSSSLQTCPARMGSDVCCGTQGEDATVDLVGGAGDPLSSTVTIRRNYQTTFLPQQVRHEKALYRIEDTYVAGLSDQYPLGTEEWGYRSVNGNGSCNSSAPGALWAYKNKRDAYTVTPWRLAAPDAGPVSAVRMEQTSQRVGGTNRDGAGSLQGEEYGYAYGSLTGAQLRNEVRRPSALANDGGVTIATSVYDASDRVVAVLTSGTTRTIGGALQQRTVGTFYKTVPICSADDPGDAATPPDSHNRVRRVEGPCVAPSASGCTGTFPVTEFEYYGDTGAGQGQLKKVFRYPDGSACGTPLVTEYLAYSPEGLPTSVRDESGVITTYSYSGGMLATETTAGLTTTYFYTGKKLTLKVYPRGNKELFCYRTSSDGYCSTGTLVDQLQWKAKLDFSGIGGAANWTERVDYEYSAQDASLRREIRSWNNGSGGEVRAETTYSKLLNGPVMSVQSGTSATMREWVSGKVDGAMNTLAKSVAYAQAPFCSTHPGLCKWMGYDRADRTAPLTRAAQRAVSNTTNRGISGELPWAAPRVRAAQPTRARTPEPTPAHPRWTTLSMTSATPWR